MMITKNTSILISGASFAGPTLAYWLKRYGFNPTVIERAALGASPRSASLVFLLHRERLDKRSCFDFSRAFECSNNHSRW
jgi:2-polyprenyl-6-methoxyphenol hydroxylase-like FAD-dependent oxidoreductase